MQIFKSLFSGNADTRSVAGVDIGSSSIKIVELQEKKGVVTLVTYGELQSGPYAEKKIGESVTLSPNKEQEALVDIIREAAVHAKRAVFAMPLSSSFVTNVRIEADKEADLSPIVRVEARKVIPVSLSEVTLDWAEVDGGTKAAEAAEAPSRTVLIAAIQNQALERFNSLMQFIGFKQPPTEIECFSTIRGLVNPNDTEAAIIDIGASSTKLYIIRSGLLMRMHRIRAGGAQVTSRIASVLDIDWEEAELKKQSADKSQSDFQDIKRAHDSSLDRGFREFAQVIAEYESNNNVTIQTIYISGGGALFPGIDSFIREALKKDVVIAHPFGKVSYPAFMQDTIKYIGPSFAVALGAALREFDL